MQTHSQTHGNKLDADPMYQDHFGKHSTDTCHRIKSVTFHSLEHVRAEDESRGWNCSKDACVGP